MKIFLLQLFCLVSLISSAQRDSVAYSREYEFREGFYLTAKNFLHNDPVKKENIITDIPGALTDFMSQVVYQKEIVYRDSAGNQKKVASEKIWGYCQNRNILINFNNDFDRVNVIGTLCHLLAPVTVYSGYHDPMSVDYGMSSTYEEMRQFVYDTRTDKLYDFNSANMEMLLRADPELHDEFIHLKKRKQAESVFIYLRKFNERHPLYLPAE